MYAYPQQAETHLAELARIKANKTGTSEEELLDSMRNEFAQLGPIVFSFDSGTSPAVKQMRHKLLMSGAGAINLEIDEIGSNLVGNTDVLNTFLELYDVGKIKQKLIKNTTENKRSEEIDGRTPANMMLYGTPSKLLNGSKTEEEFMSMLDTGYARRCLFAYSRKIYKNETHTPEELYEMLIDTAANTELESLSELLFRLADPLNFHKELKIPKKVSIELLRYKLNCESRAEHLREFEEVQKSELAHRHSKVRKLAGAYAFIDSSPEVQMNHLYAAIKITEDSGEAFAEILSRPRIHERIARYLAEVRKDVTQVDMMEDLPFYKGSTTQRRDVMTQAIAWGYRNNIIIRTSFTDNIEFFKGESLEETQLSRLTVAYSNDFAMHYAPQYAPWEQLHKLICAEDLHYTAHHFREQHRSSDKAIKGFNLVILDVDSGITLASAKELLKDYTSLFVTTKRHTLEANRFRIILPLSHVVKLDPVGYSQFMRNIFQWLPFDVDTCTKDIARKWASHPGEYTYQSGALLDAILFIPDTKKQEEQQQRFLDNAALNSLERWFLLQTDEGSRSNTLIKYAYVLADSGYDLEAIRGAIHAFNNKMKKPLPEEEINGTIMVTIARKLH